VEAFEGVGTVDVDNCNGGVANVEDIACTSAGALLCFMMSPIVVVTAGTA